MEKSNTLAIYFSEEETKKIEEAKSYGVLNDTAMFKVLIKNGLDELLQSEELIFRFDKNCRLAKKVFKTKMLRLDKQQYEVLTQINECTPFSMSSLAKYLIMPQINEILQRKEWNYRA